MDTSTDQQRHQFTRAEAVEYVKSRPAKTLFYVHVRIDLPAGERGTVCGGGSILISRQQAVKLATELCPDVLEAMGARVPVAAHDWGGGKLAVWIG